jgi:hypothetical protein
MVATDGASAQATILDKRIGPIGKGSEWAHPPRRGGTKVLPSGARRPHLRVSRRQQAAATRTKDVSLTLPVGLHYKTPDQLKATKRISKSRKREFCTCPRVLT